MTWHEISCTCFINWGSWLQIYTCDILNIVNKTHSSFCTYPFLFVSNTYEPRPHSAFYAIWYNNRGKKIGNIVRLYYMTRSDLCVLGSSQMAILLKNHATDGSSLNFRQQHGPGRFISRKECLHIHWKGG